MAKFTRIAYAEVNVRETLAEIVNDAGLKELPTFNSSLHARRASDREKVCITVTVERVADGVKGGDDGKA